MLTVETYSPKSLVVRGDLDHWLSHLQQLGGLDNKNLKGGRGFIISKKKSKEVHELVKKLNSLGSDCACERAYVLKYQDIKYRTAVPEVGHSVVISSKKEGNYRGTITSVGRGKPVMNFMVDGKFKIELGNGKWMLNWDPQYEVTLL